MGFRTIKIYYVIVDRKITKNLSNRLYQSRPPQAKNRTWRDWQTCETGLYANENPPHFIHEIKTIAYDVTYLIYSPPPTLMSFPRRKVANSVPTILLTSTGSCDKRKRKQRVAGFEWKATVQTFWISVKGGWHIDTCLISVELDFLSTVLVETDKKNQISLTTR